MVERRQLHMHTCNFIFLFSLSPPFLTFFVGRLPPPPPPPPPWLRACTLPVKIFTGTCTGWVNWGQCQKLNDVNLHHDFKSIASICLEVYTLDARYHLKAYRFIFLSIDNLFHAYVSFSEMCTGWENLEQWQRLTVANCSNIWKSDQRFVSVDFGNAKYAWLIGKKTWITTSLQSDQILKMFILTLPPICLNCTHCLAKQ